MFEVGFWELVLVFGVGLVVLGPERLPKVASQLGRWAGQARRMARNLSSQLQSEIQPVQSQLKTVEKAVDDNLRKDFSALRPDPGAPAAGQSSGTEAAAHRDAAQTQTGGDSKA
jgi:sec-independent protein translocase protein TatB